MSENRQLHLDGIRGIAALIVAAFHFLRAFHPYVGRDSLNASPLSTFWNGHFAVEVFFVLSGFLFFAKFYGAGVRQGISGGLKRYIRLTLPALAVCIAAWAIHRLDGFSNLEASAITGSDWLARWYGFPPDFGFAILEPLVAMYISFDALNTYNANLWTIRYELFVVWLVIAAAVAGPRVSRLMQFAGLAVIGALAIGSYAFPFMVGALLALVRIVWTGTLPLALSGVLLIAGLAFGALQVPIGGSINPVPVVWPLAAALVIGTIDASAALRRWMSHPLLAWVGTLSFGLYLVHFLVINSAASSVFLATRSLAITGVAYAAITLLGALAFRNLVDRPSQNLMQAAFRKASATTLTGSASA